MTQPTRLIEEAGGDELETSLLQLARSEGPSAEGRRKILAAIAAGGAASLASQSAEAASKAATKGALLKWGLVGAAALAIPAVLLLRGGGETPAPLKSAAVAAPTPAPVIEPKGTSAAVDEGPAPLAIDDLPALKNAPTAANAPKPQGSLADEVAQLQKAKLALKSGNPAQALAELSTYSQRFPRPMLGAEASVVRIEALSAGGDSARAKSLAEAFLAKNPNSPYATRLRNLTGAH
jgi:hypothetical protein